MVWGNAPRPARLGATPYGLPELFGDKLHNAPLIANPGCYPTSAILPLAPLLKEGIIEEAGLSSTARVASAEPDGRPSSAICTANATKALPPTLSAIIVISRRSSTSLNDFRVRPQLVFTPHLVPMERGILSTIYVRPAKQTSTNQVRDCLQAYFRNAPFVRILSQLPPLSMWLEPTIAISPYVRTTAGSSWFPPSITW